MTKFVQYFNICPIHDPKEFLGIAPDKDDDNVITTLSKNVVLVIKISTQKQIRSWSVLEKLSSKVVYDKQSQKYVGVFGKTVLRCWDETTTDVNKCKKLKFHRNIGDLVCSGDDILVIYSDGGYECLATAIQSRKDQMSSTAMHHNRKLHDSKVFHLNDGRKILTFFEKVQQRDAGVINDVVTLVRHSLQDTGAPIRLQLTRNDSQVRLVGYAVVEGDMDPVLLTIWSDKRIFVMKLDDFVTSDQRPGNYVCMMTAIKADGPVSIVGLTQNFIAIYGASHNTEGASLLLYNTQFKVVKAKQFFKVYFEYSHLWAIGNHILLAMGQNLSVVSYRMSKEVLSELLGAQVNNDYLHPLEGDQINEEEPLEDALSFSADALQSQSTVQQPSQMANHKYQAENVVEADGRTVPYENLDEFDQSLNALVKGNMQTQCLGLDESDKDTARILLSSNSSEDGLFSRAVEMLAQQMERCGAGEHEISEKLLTALIKANMLSDINVCLRRYTNTPDRMLVRVLKYVLAEIARVDAKPQYPEQTVTVKPQPADDANHQLHDETDDPTTEFPIVDILAHAETRTLRQHQPLFAAVNSVLASSFDESSITQHIRKDITHTGVVFLLDYIYEELTHSDSDVGGLSGVDYELQLIRWFGILLNSHFQQLALSRDIELVDTLCKWSELFAQYRHQVDELQQLSAVLYNIIQRKKLLKEKNYSKWYFIEEVNLF